MDKRKIIIRTIYPVYISLTTIPSRLQNTIKIIKNLLNYVKGFEKIILNIPWSYRRWPNEKIFIDLSDLEKNNSRLVVNRTQDLGPITKLIPTLNLTPSECIIIICDDECYHHEAFKIAAERQDKEHQSTFTFWKYNYRGIEVPQGVDLISFWKPNLFGLNEYYNKCTQKNACFYVDDLVIGNFLKEKGIKIEQLNRKWKWPYIPNCLSNKNEGLFEIKGEYSRDNSMKKCFESL
jgi:hypothetical protein